MKRTLDNSTGKSSSKLRSTIKTMLNTKCTCTIAPHDLIREQENTIAKLAQEN